MRIAIQILLILVFSGCGKIKYRETEIRGRAISLTDNSGLADYTIRLMETEIPSRPFSPISIREVATTKANENGEFSFDEELRRNSKFEYTVEFDDGGQLFFPEDWQEGEYDQVKGVVKLEKGELNVVQLQQLPFGRIKYTVTNNSISEKYLFEIFIENDKFSHREFYREMEPLETFSYDIYNGFVAGKATLKLLVTATNFSDSVIQEVEIFHNDSLDVKLVYSP